MYLSRLFLNPRSHQVQRELSDRYQLHRTILAAFPESLPADERVLFRLEESDNGQVLLLVQSQTSPNWNALAHKSPDYLLAPVDLPQGSTNPAVKSVDLKLRAGQNLSFRLAANPTIKKKFEVDKESKRIGIDQEDEQVEWLKRKLELAGSQLLAVRTSRPGTLKTSLYRQEEKHQLTLTAVQFDGVLQVKDVSLLLSAVNQGIGSAKGLGFGLLSLAPESRFSG